MRERSAGRRRSTRRKRAVIVVLAVAALLAVPALASGAVVQVVVGPEADTLAEDIGDIL